MTRIKLRVAPLHLRIAKLASRMSDPDVGGYAAFELQEEDGRFSYTVDVTAEYMEVFAAFKQMPVLLYESILRDSEVRFEDSPALTIEQVEAFSSDLTIEVLHDDAICMDQ